MRQEASDQIRAPVADPDTIDGYQVAIPPKYPILCGRSAFAMKPRVFLSDKSFLFVPLLPEGIMPEEQYLKGD